MKKQIRFHVVIGEKKPRRTTISVDPTLFEFMALKLGVRPDAEKAHSTVRTWIQDNILSTLDDADYRQDISQHIRSILIEQIAQVKLTNRRNEWLDDIYDI